MVHLEQMFPCGKRRVGAPESRTPGGCKALRAPAVFTLIVPLWVATGSGISSPVWLLRLSIAPAVQTSASVILLHLPAKDYGVFWLFKNHIVFFLLPFIPFFNPLPPPLIPSPLTTTTLLFVPLNFNKSVLFVCLLWGVGVEGSSPPRKRLKFYPIFYEWLWPS